MKTNPWIFPVLAALVTGGWIVAQKQSAATLEREITGITARIHQIQTDADAELKSRDAAEKAHNEKDQKINWKSLGEKMGKMHNGGVQDMRAMMRVQQILLEMSADELLAQYDEIGGMDLEENARKMLQSMIIGVLTEKDPKMALTRFAHEIGDEMSGASWQLNAALGKWATKDPAAATAWLDAQIAAGKFESKSLDGKNDRLLGFEGMLVNALLKTDPAAATARVRALPEDQREDFFQRGSFFHLPTKSETAYAKLVRDSLPAEKVGEILANTANMLAMQGGYERVDGFIVSTNATDDEKKSIVEEVMKNKIGQHGETKINVETLDKARAWASTQSPDIVDKATGEALASTLWRKGASFEKTSELVLQYHEKAGNDEVLAAFLKNSSVMNGVHNDKVKPLIDKIKDPALQEEIRNLPQYKN